MNLYLTIDIDLQTKLYQQLQGEQGTAAVMNYFSGEVVALANSPSMILINLYWELVRMS